MTTLTTLAQAMQSVFAQALTFACLGHPLPTLDHFCQAAAAADALVQPQAFDQRFGPKAAECLRLTLANAVRLVVATQPADLLQVVRRDRDESPEQLPHLG